MSWHDWLPLWWSAWALPPASRTQDMLLLACAPALALLVDRLLGEPPLRWHPVVWVGRYLGAMGQRIAPLAKSVQAAEQKAMQMVMTLENYKVFCLSLLAWVAGAAMVLIVSVALQVWIFSEPAWLAALALGLFFKPTLAWAMLHDEVLVVEQALGESLAAGRAQLARLVSRDVSLLDATAVRESAIESLAENLNDSVVAPLFWFALLGLPGAALYRFANTADAMWGYRGERNGRVWEWAGKWAARADDVLSWVPARLTAALLMLSALPRTTPTNQTDKAHAAPTSLGAEAARTPSPNSGWPMAAMALRLGVTLGKPGVYQLNSAGVPPEPAHLLRATALASRTTTMAGALASLFILLLLAASAMLGQIAGPGTL